MRIDAFTHIIPLNYKDALLKKANERNEPRGAREVDKIDALPSMFDLDVRFRIMNKYEGLMQVLSLGAPAIEDVVSPDEAPELARVANDGLAELVKNYPDKFPGAVACLPMNNMDAAMKEVDRAINDLGMRGIQISTDIGGKPLDSPEFMPLYEKMAYYDLPILLHPVTRPAHQLSDYPGEKESKYLIHVNFNWPYQTTLAMTRLAFSGIFEKFPNIKFVCHHCGALVPFFSERIRCSFLVFQRFRTMPKFPVHLTKLPLDYYRMFYVDTATYGSTPALMCSYSFYGADHMVVGTDMPYDAQIGDLLTREVLNSIERMEIPDSEKQKIFSENTKKLFRLAL